MDAIKKLRKVLPQIKDKSLNLEDRYDHTDRIESLFESFEENEEVVFDSWVIQNDNFLEYRSLRRSVFIAIFFIAMPMFALLINDGSRQVLIDDILNPNSSFRLYYLVNLCGLILYGFLHFVTWNQKTTGQLSFTSSKLLVENHSVVKEYDLNDLQYLEISRGSTFHMDDSIGLPYTGDNHVILKRHNTKKEILEFKIESIEHNEDLDELVRVLRINLGRKFIFKSI